MAQNDQPLQENWAPSEWGADDKAGAVNRTTPEMVLSAVKLARQGIDPISEGDCVLLYSSGDSASTEAVAADFGGETAQPFECHIKLMTRSGTWNIENLDLSPLVRDKAYEFLFTWSPLKLKGATGSPANPVAIY